MNIKISRLILVSTKFDTSTFKNKTFDFGNDFIVEKGSLQELAIVNTKHNKIILVREPTKVLPINDNIKIIDENINSLLFYDNPTNNQFVDSQKLVSVNNFLINVQLKKIKDEKQFPFLKKDIESTQTL